MLSVLSVSLSDKSIFSGTAIRISKGYRHEKADIVYEFEYTLSVRIMKTEANRKLQKKNSEQKYVFYSQNVS